MRVFRVPMFVIAGALLGLIALLATLQYRWLGQISDAERARLTATLKDRASAFAEDVDREVTRAYLLFQIDGPRADDPMASEFTARYDRWQATSRFPRLIKDIYLISPEHSGDPRPLRRYDPSTRKLDASAWPPPLAPVRAEIIRAQTPDRLDAPSPHRSTTVLYRSGAQAVWVDIPAIAIPAPVLPIPVLPINEDVFKRPAAISDVERIWKQPAIRHIVLVLDADYIRREMLPALAQQHFHDAADGVTYRLAIVPTSGAGEAVYRSTVEFSPGPNTLADARVDLFQVRAQDFASVASDVNRFAIFTRGHTMVRETVTAAKPFSILVQNRSMPDKLMVAAEQPARWRLLAQHPSGSLERAVDVARRRNLAISTGILGVLGLSVAFLVASARRAHDLAQRQLEFVATVTHELRTPLAVIRSAADNLAEGVVADEGRVRQYGDLVRREGVRLSDLVEQILEFAGLQSGQRSLACLPVALEDVLREVAAAAQAPDGPTPAIELAIATDLPAVLGDEAALRRVFQNLVGNAIKYGGDRAWVGIRAGRMSNGVAVTVSDRGIGIAPADRERIFDPFYRTPAVVAARIQGAGLGLSLVKRIIEAHGGRVTVESAPGTGSAFTVTLPIANGKTAEGPVSEEREAGGKECREFSS